MTGHTPAALPPASLYGHASVTGTDTTMWGTARLILYGTPDAPQLAADRPMSAQVRLRPDPAGLVCFAREVLAFFGEETGMELPPWQPADCGSGARPWFLIRGGPGTDRIPVRDRYRFSAAGTLIRYASGAAARRAAGKLNTAEAAAAPAGAA